MHLKETELDCELIDLESMQIASFKKPIWFPFKHQKVIIRSFHKMLEGMRKPGLPQSRWFKNHLSSLGKQLWEGLLEEIFSKFDLESHKGSFLTLALDEVTVRFPWELGSYKKRPRILLCEMLNVGRLRVVKSPSWQNLPKRRIRRTRALVVGLNYGRYRKNLEALEYPEEEAESICEVLYSKDIDPKPLIGKKATKNKISKSLRSGIDIFHFTGHGSMSKDKTVICAADRDLSTKEIRGVINETSAPRISFINACESATEKTRSSGRWEAYNWAKFLAEYAGKALVATFWPVVDESSTTLAIWFYKQFVERDKTLGEALRQARLHTKKIKKSPFTWPAYVLYGYPDLSLNSIMPTG